MFSSGKHTARDLRSRLGPDKFKQLQLLKFTWKEQLVDAARENEIYDEDIKATEELYKGLNALDEAENEWDTGEDHIGN